MLNFSVPEAEPAQPQTATTSTQPTDEAPETEDHIPFSNLTPVIWDYDPETTKKAQPTIQEAEVRVSQVNAEKEPELPKPPSDRSQKCRTYDVARNTDTNHNNAHLDYWEQFQQETDTIARYRSQWQQFVIDDSQNVYPVNAFHGRGIVFVAGNRDTYQRVITSIYLLRHHHCTLPIEVWHLPDEAPSTAIIRQLKALNVMPRDLSNQKLVRPMTQRNGTEKQFQIKPAAIINSEFEQVLYMDSDNAPTADPTFLFDTPEYKANGALFWPDYWKTNAANGIFNILDIDCQDEWEQESGQMVIHKKKSWRPLQLAWYMNQNNDIYFQFLNGDKDTFKYAWKALDHSYDMNPIYLAMAGTQDEDGEFCGHTMLQFPPPSYAMVNSQPLFVHANLLKVTSSAHFMQQDMPGIRKERPWRFVKQYTESKGNTYLRPEFYVSADGRPCMDFGTGQGEPAIRVTAFNEMLPDFQRLYFEYGGIGGAAS
ncbi:nucleotide-diphospho-sugar transferase [Hesseltinella vesiculosa]|uniref:Nucleotide-diphospho-sugar transferase n=1 Tax=Hesseltinella vesiculosa TaxID=101127 RepID=A0A1X2GA01_9FUNG|nr:nucleotide-diphospho-sugar transferase [Hesseltinella vesiculosa]